MKKLYRKLEFYSKLGLALNYDRFEEHDAIDIHLIWGQLFINLPWGGNPEGDMVDSWGFTFFERQIHLHWRNHTKVMSLPWSWKHVRTDMWSSDGKKFSGEEVEKLYGKDRLDFLQAPEEPYLYVLKSGKIQERLARYYVEEREWRWRWATRLPWPRIIQRCIWVEFNDEVGERTGSWKGGVLGCDYTLEPGESALECLKRMERERKFT